MPLSSSHPSNKARGTARFLALKFGLSHTSVYKLMQTQLFRLSKSCRIDDDWLPASELLHLFDHVLSPTGAVAGFSIPQRHKGSPPQPRRECGVEHPAITAVVDANSLRCQS